MGYLFALAGALDYANKAVAVADFMTFWTNSVPAGVWITMALIIPVAFNLLNVRKNGDIEFVLTMTKITVLVILMVGHGRFTRSILVGHGSKLSPGGLCFE